MWSQLSSFFILVTALLIAVCLSIFHNDNPASASQISYTNQELEDGFTQRDQVLQVIIDELEAHRIRLEKLESAGNEKNTK